MTRRARIAFVKQAGLTAGGTERWLQSIAASLPQDRFDVTYFWSGVAEEIGTDHRSQPPSPERRQFLERRGVRLVEFSIGAIDGRRPTGPWLATDFWDHFDPGAFDLVQTAKRGPAEYPFTEMSVPVFEIVAYQGGVDRSASIVRSCHPSEWSRAWWWRRGGPLSRSFVARIPASGPSTREDMRSELGITRDTVVLGFHQRPDDRIFSPIPLDAARRLREQDVHVVVLGGSTRYAEQAERIGLERVTFVPATSDARAVSRFLNTLDLFTHGRSDGETFGLAIAEAMRHGVPCLSHAVLAGANGHRETIGPGGLVVKGPEEYAHALQRFVADPLLRRSIAERAQRHADAHYSEAGAVAPIVREYDAHLAGQHPPRQITYGAVAPGVLVVGEVGSADDEASSVLTGRSWVEAVVAAMARVPGRFATVLVSRRLSHLAVALSTVPGLKVAVLVSSGDGPLDEDTDALALNPSIDRVARVVVDEAGSVPGPCLLVTDHRDVPPRDLACRTDVVRLTVAHVSSLGAPRQRLRLRWRAVSPTAATALRLAVHLRWAQLCVVVANWRVVVGRPLHPVLASVKAEIRCALRRVGLRRR